MRAYGKDFDAYYERAKNSGAVRFVRSMISRVVEDPLTNNLHITYLDENQKLITETFDMVILAAGLKVSEQSKKLAEMLGVELNESGFCATSSFDPVQSTRPGVFVAGMLQGPKDSTNGYGSVRFSRCLIETFVVGPEHACYQGRVSASTGCFG